jgi:hypothetical protein
MKPPLELPRRALWLALTLGVLLRTGVCRAGDVEAEARRHYDRAVERFVAGDYPQALLELQRAAELRPSYKLWYSMGQVRAALGDAAGASRAYQTYLDQGGAKLSPERRAQVREEIAALARRASEPAAADEVPASRAAHERPVEITPAGRAPRAARALVSPAPAAPRGSEPELPAGSAWRPPLWVGWLATGALGAGALATGLWALSKNDALADQRARGDVSKARLESNASELRTLALLTDGLWLATAAAAGVSLWLSLDGPSAEPGEPRAALGAHRSELRLGVAASGISLQGAF